MFLSLKTLTIIATVSLLTLTSAYGTVVMTEESAPASFLALEESV